MPSDLEPAPAPTPNFSLGAALTHPFRQPGWFYNLWWVFFLTEVPVFRWVAMRGWRISLARNIGLGHRETLPTQGDLPQVFGRGVVLWGMFFLYYLPAVAVIAFLTATQYELVLEIFWWLVDRFVTGNPVQEFGVLFGKSLTWVAGKLGITAVYFVITGPVYRASMIRYCLTGKKRSFFQVHKSLMLVFKHFGYFVYVYFMEVAMMSLTTFLAAQTAALLTTLTLGAGALLVPLVLPPVFVATYFWTTGALFGALALRVSGDVLGGADDA